MECGGESHQEMDCCMDLRQLDDDDLVSVSYGMWSVLLNLHTSVRWG